MFVARATMRWILLVVLAPCFGACGAYVSYETRLAELDSVLQWAVATSDATELSYRDDPEAMPWLAKAFGPVSEALGVKPRPQPQENPRSYARDRMLILTDAARGDVGRSVILGQRLLTVADLDGAALGRIIALDCLVELLLALDLDALEGAFVPPASDEEFVVAAQRLRELAPDRRVAAAETAGWRQRYRDDLALLTELPAATPAHRRRILSSLVSAWQLEEDPELRSPTGEAAVRALRWGVQRSLVEAMNAAGETLAPVRLAAIRLMHRAGGNQAVAVILALKERRSQYAAQGLDRFDDDPIVRLELVNMCGQLPGAVAGVGAQRSADPANRGPAPIEFLYSQVAASDEAMPGLQLMALESLSLCLGRPPEFDAEWAHRWWLDRAGAQ